jgi:hypothetical protein
MMKTSVILSFLAASASAFAPISETGQASTSFSATEICEGVEFGMYVDFGGTSVLRLLSTDSSSDVQLVSKRHNLS